MFVSMPHGPHAQITREAARAAGWPRHRLRALVTATHRPDREEVTWEPAADMPARYDVDDGYRPAHHADRLPPQTHAEAWDAAGRYIRAERHRAATADDLATLLDATGRALHALQDACSHTDLIDHGPEDREGLIASLLDGSPPVAVRVAATVPHAKQPGDAAAYSHDQVAKDMPLFNEESRIEIGASSKYELARDAAVGPSRRLLEQILATLSPAMHRRLRRRTWPAAVLVAGGLAGVGWWVWRR